MNFEETIRTIVREELERREETIARRIASLVRSELAGGTSVDRLLRAEEIEPLTGCSPETVKRWVREGKLRRYGTPRAWRVSQRELWDYLSKLPGADAAPTDAQIVEMAKARAARGR